MFNANTNAVVSQDCSEPTFPAIANANFSSLLTSTVQAHCDDTSYTDSCNSYFCLENKYNSSSDQNKVNTTSISSLPSTVNSAEIMNVLNKQIVMDVCSKCFQDIQVPLVYYGDAVNIIHNQDVYHLCNVYQPLNDIKDVCQCRGDAQLINYDALNDNVKGDKFIDTFAANKKNIDNNVPSLILFENIKTNEETCNTDSSILDISEDDESDYTNSNIILKNNNLVDGKQYSDSQKLRYEDTCESNFNCCLFSNEQWIAILYHELRRRITYDVMKRATEQNVLKKEHNLENILSSPHKKEFVVCKQDEKLKEMEICTKCFPNLSGPLYQFLDEVLADLEDFTGFRRSHHLNIFEANMINCYDAAAYFQHFVNSGRLNFAMMHAQLNSVTNTIASGYVSELMSCLLLLPIPPVM